MDNILKTCCKCKEVKDISEFVKDKNKPSGLTAQCKKCRSEKQKEWVALNPDKVKALNEKHRENRKEYYNSPERKLKYRKNFIKRSFGIEYSEYERMQEEQDNLCDICRQPETNTIKKYLSVDHCHTTGKIRGLLCNSCNHAIGFLKDDISILENAIKYLKKHEI